ncbi:MAG: hypothetical protein LBL96_08615 [Clostridiales bacterium]|jgi:hypothetical protein|nr:hypothetical protein [Clostridiales bacterium]
MRHYFAIFAIVLAIFGLRGTHVYANISPLGLIRYTNTKVNFRKGPGQQWGVIKSLTRGTKIQVNSTDNNANGGWAQVDYNGEAGFVKMEYLCVDKPKTPTDYPVELLTWSETKPIVPLGEDLKIYDIWSQTTYYVRSFSNGNHADVEPVTQADTAIMLSLWGSWSWDGRPVWVTFGGKTIAAAINGMPHAKGINDANGMNGQICLHFKGSQVHNGNRSYENELQGVINKAWTAAQ